MFPVHNVPQWYGIMAVAGTSPNVLDRLQEAVTAAIRSNEVKQKLEQERNDRDYRLYPSEISALH
jgi:tripartite-type tricarboxylate transporter receptor subunit TctC